MDILYIPGNVSYFVSYYYVKEFLQKIHDNMKEKQKLISTTPNTDTESIFRRQGRFFYFAFIFHIQFLFFDVLVYY
jgi:hypothetical protein